MPTLRLDLSFMEESSSQQALPQHNHGVAEQIVSRTAAEKAFPPNAEPLPVTPCTIASHQDGGASSVSNCKSPDSRSVPSAPKCPASESEPGQQPNNVDAAATERTVADDVLFLRKLRTKIAADQAFRQRLRTAIALHEQNGNQQQQRRQPRQDVLLAALSASRKIPPPPLTGPAASERSLDLLGLRGQRVQQEVRYLPSPVLEAELAKRHQIRWHQEQHIRLAALIEEEERELEAERLDLAVQAARLQVQAASVRLATAQEAELLASEMRATDNKRDTYWDRQREDFVASVSPGARQHMRGSDDTISTDIWNDHLQSLVQSMKASEASFVEVQSLYGAHGSLPSSYRSVINRSQSSRQDILVLLGEKRKRDNCIVEMKSDLSNQELCRGRPTKRRKEQNWQDPTPPSEETDHPSTCRSTLPSSPGNDSISSNKKGAGRKTKKAKRWTWKKKPGAPSRPLSAYNIFFSEERRRIIDEMERKNSDEIDSTAGQDEHDDNIESPGEASTSPRIKPTISTEDKSSSRTHHPGEFAFDMLMERRINPTTNYKQRNSKSVKKQNIVAYKDLTKTIAARWKSLPPEELAEYKRLADLDTKRYKEDVEKFNNQQEEVAAAEALKGLIRGSVLDA